MQIFVLNLKVFFRDKKKYLQVWVASALLSYLPFLHEFDCRCRESAIPNIPDIKLVDFRIVSFFFLFFIFLVVRIRNNIFKNVLLSNSFQAIRLVFFSSRFSNALKIRSNVEAECSFFFF